MGKDTEEGPAQGLARGGVESECGCEVGIPVVKAGWPGFRGLGGHAKEPFSVPLLDYETQQGHRPCLSYSQVKL